MFKGNLLFASLNTQNYIYENIWHNISHKFSFLFDVNAFADKWNEYIGTMNNNRPASTRNPVILFFVCFCLYVVHSTGCVVCPSNVL